MERTYEAPSNEAPHMILGYHQGRLVTYLQIQFSSQWHPAKPRTGTSVFFSTVSNPKHCTVFAIWMSCIRT